MQKLFKRIADAFKKEGYTWFVTKHKIALPFFYLFSKAGDRKNPLFRVKVEEELIKISTFNLQQNIWVMPDHLHYFQRGSILKVVDLLVSAGIIGEEFTGLEYAMLKIIKDNKNWIQDEKEIHTYVNNVINSYNKIVLKPNEIGFIDGSYITNIKRNPMPSLPLIFGDDFVKDWPISRKLLKVIDDDNINLFSAYHIVI